MKCKLFLICLGTMFFTCADSFAKPDGHMLGKDNGCIGKKDGGQRKWYWCGKSNADDKGRCPGTYLNGSNNSNNNFTNGMTTVVNNDYFICCGGTGDITGTFVLCTDNNCTQSNDNSTYSKVDDICAHDSTYGTYTEGADAGKCDKTNYNICCKEEMAASNKVAGTCTYKIDMCGNPKGEVCTADVDNCPGDAFARNKACVTTCPQGQMFASQESNECTSDCPVTKTSGPGTEDRGTVQNIPVCKHCIPGVELYSPVSRSCISKNDTNQSKPIQRKTLLDCWKCSDSVDMKKCINGGPVCEIEIKKKLPVVQGIKVNLAPGPAES